MNHRKLYSTEFDTKNFTVKRHVSIVEDDYASYNSAEEAQGFGGAGYATYNEDGYETVYAESLVSQEDADNLVRTFCKNMITKFNSALEAL